jgi:hypothetical protein
MAGPNDGEPSLSVLIKSSKNAKDTLSSVLHIDSDNTTGKSITDIVADLNSENSLR